MKGLWIFRENTEPLQFLHYNYIALQFYPNEFSYHDLIMSRYGLLTAKALLFWGEAYILQWNNVGRDETINFSSRVCFRMRVVLILLDAKALLLGIRGSLPISRGWNETAYIFAKVSFIPFLSYYSYFFIIIQGMLIGLSKHSLSSLKLTLG